MSQELPISWADELKAVYPQRSGPSGWGSMKLMLELRRALQTSTWERILDGCKSYKAYCDQSGKTGTDYVQTPLRFIGDGCYLEEFTYQAPQTQADKDRSQAQQRDAARLAEITRLGSTLNPPLSRYPQESIASFETRVRLVSVGIRRTDEGMGHNQGPQRETLGSAITSLARRLKA